MALFSQPDPGTISGKVIEGNRHTECESAKASELGLTWPDGLLSQRFSALFYDPCIGNTMVLRFFG